AEAMRTLSTTCLSLPHRLLHIIVTHFIEPQKGTFAKVTMKDAFLLCYLIEKKKIDLPFIILSVMNDTVKNASKQPGYGMIITRILTAAGVDLTGETSKNLTGYETLGSPTAMGKLGLDITDGVWHLRDEGVTAGTEAYPANVEETSVGPTPSAQPSRRGRRAGSAYTQGEGPSAAPWVAIQAQFDAFVLIYLLVVKHHLFEEVNDMNYLLVVKHHLFEEVNDMNYLLVVKHHFFDEVNEMNDFLEILVYMCGIIFDYICSIFVYQASFVCHYQKGGILLNPRFWTWF
ncbi:hypothetical protein Ancab_015580, partial [Ancistrocladus abbreviatus]